MSCWKNLYDASFALLTVNKELLYEIHSMCPLKAEVNLAVNQHLLSVEQLETRRIITPLAGFSRVAEEDCEHPTVDASLEFKLAHPHWEGHAVVVLEVYNG